MTDHELLVKICREMEGLRSVCTSLADRLHGSDERHRAVDRILMGDGMTELGLGARLTVIERSVSQIARHLRTHATTQSSARASIVCAVIGFASMIGTAIIAAKLGH